MADRVESENEAKQLRSTVLETATSVLQIRQRAEQEIRRTSEVLEQRTRELAQALVIMRATLESTTDAILVTDDKVKVTDFNEKFIEMWKIPREVLESGMISEVRDLASQNFADPQRFIARIKEIAATGRESFDLLELKDGRIFERYSKVLTTEGQSAGRVWSFRDVTERHLAEITARRLAAIVASSEDAIVGKDLNSIITSWNLGAERIFGYTAEEMIGTSIMRLIPMDRQNEELAILSRIRRGERFDHFETIRLAKDGRQLNVSVTVSPIKDSTGYVVGASKVARDITERKKAEERERKLLAEAATANAKFRAFFEEGPLFAGIMAVDGSIIEANRLSLEACGYTKEQVVGKPFWECPWWCRSAALVEQIKFAIGQTALGQIFQAEMPYFVADGSQRMVNLLILPIKDETGRVVFLVPTGTDITDLKRAESQRDDLLQAERAARASAERASLLKDEFLATLSHELRTPLNAVLGWANILRLGKLQGEELKQGLETIERNARAQLEIIEDLLDMSRIISGKVRLDVQRLDISSIVQSAVETARPTAEAKGIRLQTVIDPLNGVVVSGDVNRLQQVLWNLLSNAVKFTPKGGCVQVLLKRIDSHLEISVIDTGEGIAPEFLPYVFDRFQQGDASTTRRHSGLGLGLAIVKQLVELHGGNVLVKSGGIGQGATFTLHLPLTAIYTYPDEEGRHQPAALRENQPLPEVSLADVRVLVVDDEIDGRELVKRLLEMAGATVSTAGSASEAMERILAGRPDVLVCDIGMPGEDGYSLIRRLRVIEERQKSALPAVALTAYARSEDRTKAIRSGFQNHLAKPVEPAEFLAVVSSLAGRTVMNPPDASS
jgi:PAS domain S-box-containing protein